MKSAHKIAILDTAVNSNIVDAENSRKLNDKTTFKNVINKQNSNLSHGTLCAKIIEKYDPSAMLICIKVLEDDDFGLISELEDALEWCFSEQIFMVNLSLGTVNSLNRASLLSVVNYYANRGMIIIAATSNMGLRTYPASFSNVIGVASNEVMNYKQLDSTNLGIDIQEKAEHVIEIKGNFLTTPKSNSFATPCISAVVAKLREKIDDCYNVSVIKNELYKSAYCTYPMASCNAPDWISAAYLIGIDENKKGYYFKVTNIEEADTVIVYTKEMLDIYKKYKKHMVYLGGEVVKSPNARCFFWSKQNKIRQIKNVRMTENQIKIPILILEQSCGIDEIEMLCELKKQFENEKYNFCAVSTKIESVLYDIEYIPEELLEQKLQIYSFVYWQTYIQQSNIVALATSDLEKLRDIFEDADITIKVQIVNNLVQVIIMFEGENYEKVYNQYCIKELVIDVYGKITKYFNEKNT